MSSLLIFLFIILFVVLVGCVYTSYLVFAALSAAPYVATQDVACRIMLDLAEIKPGTRVVELGSGNGEVSIEAAKRGAVVTGIELNPLLVVWAYYRAFRAGVGSQVCFRRGNIWRTLPLPADVVFVYLLPETLARLWPLLQKTYLPGTRLISNAFAISGVTPEQVKEGVYCYRF